MIDAEGDNTFAARVITMVVDGQAQVAPGAENAAAMKPPVVVGPIH